MDFHRKVGTILTRPRPILEGASTERLLALRRGHWSIENKSHWILNLEKTHRLSDVVLFRSYGCFVKCSISSHVIYWGYTYIADKIKYFASKTLHTPCCLSTPHPSNPRRCIITMNLRRKDTKTPIFYR